MNGLTMILLFLVLLCTGLPVAFSLSGTALLYILANGIQISVVIQRMVNGINSFPLIAVPLFIFAANLMNSSGVTNKLFNFTKLFVGHIRGGLAQVNCLASLIFSGISGAALADVGGLGNIEISAMRAQGYTKEDAAAITVASATVGPIFPPSIPLVIYATVAGASSARLLIAGIVPGLLLTVALMVQVAFFAKKRCYPRCTEKRTARETVHTVVTSIPALMMPTIMLVGMLSGYFSPTETSAVAVSYALILGICTGEIDLKRFIAACKDTVFSTASVLFIVASASVFAWALTVEQMPQQLADAVLGLTENRILILILTNVILLIAGMFLDSSAAILILTPVLLPIMQQIGVSEIQFGIIMVLNLMIGLLTPPFGISIFMVSSMTDIPVTKMFRAVSPYLISLLIALMIVTFVPSLSIALPNLAFGAG